MTSSAGSAGSATNRRGLTARTVLAGSLSISGGVSTSSAVSTKVTVVRELTSRADLTAISAAGEGVDNRSESIAAINTAASTSGGRDIIVLAVLAELTTVGKLTSETRLAVVPVGVGLVSARAVFALCGTRASRDLGVAAGSARLSVHREGSRGAKSAVGRKTSDETDLVTRTARDALAKSLIEGHSVSNASVARISVVCRELTSRTKNALVVVGSSLRSAGAWLTGSGSRLGGNSVSEAALARFTVGRESSSNTERARCSVWLKTR